MSNPDEISQLKRRAQALLDIKRAREAVALLLPGLAQAPDDAGLLCLLCVAHFQQREWKPAEQYADKALAADPDSAWAHALKSQLLLRRFRRREAVKAAETAVRLAPHHAEYLQPLFDAYISCGQVKKAEVAARRFREERPDLTTPHELLASLALMRNKRKEAEGHLRLALTLDPACVSCLAQLGLLLAQRRKTDESVRLLHAAVRLDPVDARTRGHLGRIAFSYAGLPLILLGSVGALTWMLLGLGFHVRSGTAYLLVPALITLPIVPLHRLRPQWLLAWQPGYRALPHEVQQSVLLMWARRWPVNAAVFLILTLACMLSVGFALIVVVSMVGLLTLFGLSYMLLAGCALIVMACLLVAWRHKRV